MKEKLQEIPTQFEQQGAHLEPKPREFSVDDIKKVQGYMKYLHDRSIKDDADFIPKQDGLYIRLTEGLSNAEVEPSASEDSFDRSVSTVLSAWGERRGLGASGPQSLVRARELFQEHPTLNDVSPIHFQGGAEYVSGRFVHVVTGRAMGKSRELPTYRYYLNPTADKMGYVVEQLTGVALNSKVPLYFKFVNVATGRPNQRTMGRTDRIVVYASDAQTSFIEGTLGHIVAEVPEAFSGRNVSGFGETLADGITRSDEVTKEQSEKFKGDSEGISFNSLRSQFIYEATMGVTKDLITLPDFASIKIGNQTIRQKFVAELSKAINQHRPDVVIREDDPELLRALELGLISSKLRESGQFSDKALQAIEDAVGRTARDVLPGIQADSLLSGYKHHIRRLAPEYGTDPDNLARNIPIVT